MAVDTITFDATHPADAEGVSFTGVTLLRWRKSAPLRRRVVHDVLGLGHTLHYLGPGGQKYIATIRVEGATWQTMEAAIDAVLELDGAFGTVTITPGTTGQRDSRLEESHENMLLEEIVQGDDKTFSRDAGSIVMILSFLKLQIVGTIG